MEVKGQQGSLGYNNNPIFRETSETLDRHHPLQQNSTRRQNPDQFNGSGGERVAYKSGGSSFITGARFRECMKNHAASVGGNVLDGCGEFMPSGEDGTLEALKCAACNCHRNFHRREPDHGSEFALHLPPPLPSPSYRQHQRLWNPIVSPVKIAFGGGGGTDSSSEDLNFNTVQSNAAGAPLPPPFVLSKKRFRSKFTQEQKEKMLEYAEKVGWRIPREDDAEMQRFCAEVGVKRQVLKVWMHNNKNSSTKKPPQEGESQGTFRLGCV
ncbi:Zinc-finger homeodomain protein [Actinidia chinensis var. chinensis]|uniref:Zinc-finger homeodomain protein n=1 Tax=Actinidia chinensis var. chinensis TaxID=1590841 RepID=A0A2R6RMS7_ACTCC|nr:Zinc-finger homeodomain protein [Actinidia chinensis var. chinensis]